MKRSRGAYDDESSDSDKPTRLFLGLPGKGRRAIISRRGPAAKSAKLVVDMRPESKAILALTYEARQPAG
jgi:hypothetical protein